MDLRNKGSDIALLLQLFLLSIHITTQCKKTHKFSNAFAKDYLHLVDDARKISASTKALTACNNIFKIFGEI